MARKKRSVRNESNTTIAQVRSDAVSSWLLWCIAIWGMFLARTPFAFVERMQLLPFPDQSLLSQGRAWNPPLTYVAAHWDVNEIPYWFGALLVAVVLATAVRWQAASENVLVMAAGVVGLVLVAQPFPLGDLLCLLLVAYLIERHKRMRGGGEGEFEGGSGGERRGQASRGEVRTEMEFYGSAIAIFVTSVFVSLEFGLIAILVSCLLIGPQTKRLRGSLAPRTAVGVPIVWCLLVCLPGFFMQGYFATLLRPLSWAWLDAPASLLPSMVPAWESRELNWSYALLALPIAERWRQAVIGKLPFFACLYLGLFTWIGFGCAHYLWLVAAAVLVTGRGNLPKPDTNISAFARRYAQCAWLMLGFALLGVVLQVTMNGATILASDTIRRAIDSTQWNLRGPVLLSNLEQSSSWQQRQQRRRYQLLLTDRWDIHHLEYNDYLATLYDWSNWRREAYQRDNGEWGGYQAKFSEWDPRLVVVDTSELSAIHRVSIDSKWKVIGIDHEKVVFVSRDAPQNRPLIQYAGTLLSTLELPRPGAETDFQRVLAVGSPADARRVSGVLTALRLPYAALRVLPDDRQPSTRTAAVFAWCELAHRSHRYSGQYSLLDCCRGLSATTFDGAKSLIEQTNRYRQTLAAAIRADVSTTTSMTGSPAVMDIEPRIRWHLLLGERVLAVEQSEKLSNAAKRAFYTIIAESVSLSTAECIGRLDAVRESLNGELNAECSFYIGCLAIEAGDFLLAREAFATLSRNASSPFATIADFYHSQL